MMIRVVGVYPCPSIPCGTWSEKRSPYISTKTIFLSYVINSQLNTLFYFIAWASKS